MGREEEVAAVFDLWEHGRNDEAVAMLASLELRDAGERNDVIVQWDRRLYREDRPTIVPDERLILAHYVAIHNRCQVMVTSRDETRYVRFIGYSADVDMDMLLYRYFLADLLNGLADLHVESLRKKDREEAHSTFGEKFAWNVHQKLSAVRSAVESLARANRRVKLLDDRSRNVRRQYRESYPNLTIVQFPQYKEKGSLTDGES